MSLNYSGSMRIKIGLKTIMHEVEASLSESRDFEELASKDITGKDFYPKEGTWSLTGNAIAANSTNDEQVDLQSIVEIYQQKTKVDVELTDNENDNIGYSGKAYIESYNLTSANEDKVKYDFSLKGVGELIAAVHTSS